MCDYKTSSRQGLIQEKPRMSSFQKCQCIKIIKFVKNVKKFGNGRREYEVKYRGTRQGQNRKEGEESRKSFYVFVFVSIAFTYTLSQG